MTSKFTEAQAAALARSATGDLDIDHQTRQDCIQQVLLRNLEHPEMPVSHLWWEARRHALKVLFDRGPKDPGYDERAWAIGETFARRQEEPFDVEEFQYEILWLMRRARKRGGQRTERAAQRDYTILLLSRWCDSNAEIAEIMGLSVAQIKKARQFIRKVLSEFIEEQEQ